MNLPAAARTSPAAEGAVAAGRSVGHPATAQPPAEGRALESPGRRPPHLQRRLLPRGRQRRTGSETWPSLFPSQQAAFSAAECLSPAAACRSSSVTRMHTIYENRCASLLSTHSHRYTSSPKMEKVYFLQKSTRLGTAKMRFYLCLPFVRGLIEIISFFIRIISLRSPCNCMDCVPPTDC